MNYEFSYSQLYAMKILVLFVLNFLVVMFLLVVEN